MKIKLYPGRLPEDFRLRHPASLIATWFGVGLAPMASGTWGSLAAIPLGLLVAFYFGTPGLVVATLVATAAGVWASDVLVRRSGVQDPGFIVIDEVAGMLLTMCAAPLTCGGVALAFLAFRAADIVKPFPANWCDRNVHGGVGVMLDDLVAAVYSALAVYVISYHAFPDYLLGPTAR